MHKNRQQNNKNMRTTLLTGLLVAAGVGGQALATETYNYNYSANRANKVGLLQLSLTGLNQLYWNGASSAASFAKPGTFGVMTAPGTSSVYQWNDHSYRHLENCAGTVTYKSQSTKINNQRLIQSINAAMLAVDGDSRGLFVNPSAANIWNGKLGETTTKLVITRYENEQQAPPYPPTMDVYWNGYVAVTGNDDVWQAQWYNAPWDYGTTLGMAYGDMFQLQWPNKNVNSWGKPRTTAGGTLTWDYEIAPIVSDGTVRVAKPGMQVFAIDPANVNVNLRCFDVTPFFTIEEGVCQYCWDTMDRVTDGKIVKSSLIPGSLDLPCQAPGPTPDAICTVKGSGTTYFYMTLKFNNISAERSININGAGNALLKDYYTIIVGGPKLGALTWTTPLAFGTKLDAADKTGSAASLNFEVGGLTTYKWAYQPVTITGNLKVTEVMGAMSLNAQGHGWSPLCGVLTGPVTITEVAASNSSFKGAATCVNGNFPAVVTTAP